MAIVKPFKAVRPSRDKVALVSSKSFDAYTDKELDAKLEFNPFTFLHIINPGYKYHQEFSGGQRFQMIHNRYEEFKENKIFIKEDVASFYIYESSDAHDSFCGIIASTAVDDYDNGTIKKHEGTIKKREQLFETYLKATGFNAEPVLLTYKDDENFNTSLEIIKKKRPEYEFSTTDKKLHRLWLVNDKENIKKIISFFENIEALYIADGHHRSASSSLLKKDLQEENIKHTGNENYNYFMSYIIPESNLKISEFNRFIKGLNGLSIDELLIELDKSYRIEDRGEHYYKPSQKHHFSMYLGGKFYSLYLRKNSFLKEDPLSKLDAEILYRTILKPILGINNLDNNNRISYRNNKLDLLSIKTLVDDGQFDIGFGMLPITIDEMKKIADAKLIMPPKTSYIEPKLRSGLTMYEF
jgi:uncharacterized protein (DUF1015 family)